ncbi:MAG: putative quinol monooxygenase [Novosphingobium sp.]
MQFSIVAEFEIKPGCEVEFRELLLETARYARLEEPGCLRFEIIQPTDRDGNPIPGKLMTNELFEDFAGVEAHRASPRTPPRIRRVEELTSSRRVVHAAVLGTGE